MSIVAQAKDKRQMYLSDYRSLWDFAIAALEEITQADHNDPEAGLKEREKTVRMVYRMARCRRSNPKIRQADNGKMLRSVHEESMIWKIWNLVFEDDPIMPQMLEQTRRYGWKAAILK